MNDNIPPSNMVCTNCGADTSAESHRLLFSTTDGAPKELDLTLCDRCLREILDEPGIETASTRHRATVE